MAIIVVYGIPGSGKTTVCERLRLMDKSIYVSSFDETAIVEGECEKIRRKRAQDASIAKIKDHMDSVHLVDDVFYMQSMRRPFERLSRSLGLEYGAIFVEASVENAVERDRQRSCDARVGEECIIRIEERMERSTVGEEMVYRSTDDLLRIKEWIDELKRKGRQKRIKMGEETEREERLRISDCLPIQSSTSDYNEMDLALRRIVSQMCRGGADGRMLSKVKKKIMEEIRRGEKMNENEIRRRIEYEMKRRKENYDKE
ncbi:hypothetical protein PFISCL1PPCAC_24870, partial [Pristionchus fissidentatus]